MAACHSHIAKGGGSELSKVVKTLGLRDIRGWLPTTCYWDSARVRASGAGSKELCPILFVRASFPTRGRNVEGFKMWKEASETKLI